MTPAHQQEQGKDPVSDTIIKLAELPPNYLKNNLTSALEKAKIQSNKNGLFLTMELKKQLLDDELKNLSNHLMNLVDEVRKPEENNQNTEKHIQEIAQEILELNNNNSSELYIKASGVFNKNTLASIKNQKPIQQQHEHQQKQQRQQELAQRQEHQKQQQQRQQELAQKQEHQRRQQELAQRQEHQRQQQQQEALVQQQKEQDREKLLKLKIKQTTREIENHLSQNDYPEVERIRFIYSHHLNNLPIECWYPILHDLLNKHSEIFKAAHQDFPTEYKERPLLSLLKIAVDIIRDYDKKKEKKSAKIIQKHYKRHHHKILAQRELHQSIFLPVKNELLGLMQQKQAATKIQAAIRRHSAQKLLQQKKSQRKKSVLTKIGVSSAISGSTAGAIVAASTHLSFITILAHASAALAITVGATASGLVLPFIPLAIAAGVLYKKKYPRPPTQTILAICDRQPEPPTCSLNP